MTNTNNQLAIPFPTRSSYERRRYMGAHLWWHEAIIDEMLAHPDWTKKQIASKLGCTPAMIYLLTNSDLFRSKFEQRRKEFSSVHDQAIVGQLTAVAESALSIIQTTLEKKRDAIPLPLLVDLADRTLERLGYGAKQQPAAAVQVNVGAQQAIVSVSADDLNEARAALRAAEQRRIGSVPEGNGAASFGRVSEGHGASGFERTVTEGAAGFEQVPRGIPRGIPDGLIDITPSLAGSVVRDAARPQEVAVCGRGAVGAETPSGGAHVASVDDL